MKLRPAALTVALMSVAFSGSLHAAELFTYASPPSSPDDAQSSAHASLASLDSVGQPFWIQLDPRAVSTAMQTLEFELDGSRRQARQVSSSVLADGTVTWSGSLLDADGQEGSIELIRTASGVSGIIKEGGLYRIESVDGATHLLVRDRLLPALPRHASNWSAGIGRRAGDTDLTDAAPASARTTEEPSVLRVMVVTNKATHDRYGERVKNRALLGFSEGNRTYLDSRINARMELASFYVVGYPGRTMGEAFNYFMNPTTRGGKWAWAKRTADKADVIMIVMGNDYYCGVAPVGARAHNALMVVRYECLTGNDTVPHEMGHIHGSSHNPEQGGQALYPWAWGRRVCNQGRGNWHSVMAYPCGNGSARAQKWTSPVITHNGVPTGNASRFDNRRVMEENRARVAGFR